MSIVTTFSEPSDTTFYSIAIIIPTFSLLMMILIAPALVQHYRNRNIGATALVAGVTVSLFNGFINALIWPNDDMTNWYNGVGLCDVEVKVMIFQGVLYPASVCCILRSLAAVMNTNSQTWIQTTAQKRRGYAIDLLCCVGAPSIQMLFHYLVQPNRYYIFGIAGCTPSTDLSWLAVLLIIIQPLIWTTVDVFYAVLVMIRLIRYRLTFNAILANSNTTRSRFLRLYVLCCGITCAMFPLAIYTLYINVQPGVGPYHWSTTHPTDGSWNQAIFVRSNGGVFWDRITWLCGSALVFCLFGFGRDALKLYREALLTIGLGRCFPGLRPERTRHGSVAATSVTTLGSRARLWLHRKETNATWTNSTASMTDSTGGTPSPQKTTTFFPPSSSPQMRSGPFAGLSSILKKQKKPDSAPPASRHDSLVLTHVAGPSAFQSTVTAGEISPTTVRHFHGKKQSGAGEVLVLKEVRQASETAATMPVVVRGTESV